MSNFAEKYHKHPEVMHIKQKYISRTNRMAEYPSENPNDIVNNLYELMENIDAILSAKDSFLHMFD